MARTVSIFNCAVILCQSHL